MSEQSSRPQDKVASIQCDVSKKNDGEEEKDEHIVGHELYGGGRFWAGGKGGGNGR